ncbi:MAG: branched-chain amino acid ABC transporter permease [Ignisphaera sp.]
MSILRKESPLFVFMIIGVIIPICTSNQYLLHILILIYLLAILGASWDLIAGYGGIFSFGHQAFYAIGAYSASILSIKYGVSSWFGLVIGGFIAMILSLMIAYPTIKLRGPYIALITLSFSLIVYELIIIFRDFTGGPSGLWGIPTFSAIKLGLIDVVFSYVERTSFYYLALMLVATTILTLRIYSTSRYGLYIRVIKESEEAAETMGINTLKHKLLAFSISSFFTGLAGAFYAYYVQLITPELTWISTMLDIVLATLIGGAGTIYGSLIGSTVVLFLKEYLRFLGHLRLVIFGIILMMIIIFTPRGLVLKVIERMRKLKGRKETVL